MKYYKYLWTEEGATRLEKKLNRTYTELRNGINSKEGDEEEGSNVEKEFYRSELAIHDSTVWLFNTERSVYRRLQDLQGKSISRIIAEVELPGFYSSRYSSPDVSTNTLAVKSLLMEYIDGFTLEKIAYKKEHENWPAPGECFQTIIDGVLDVTRTIIARDTVNRDSKLRNALVRYGPNPHNLCALHHRLWKLLAEGRYTYR